MARWCALGAEKVTAAMRARGVKVPSISPLRPRAHITTPPRSVLSLSRSAAPPRAQRLVALSSMGIGDDFLPLSPIKAFWACLLATLLRSTRADLSAMEDTITSSGLDFLLVRPTHSLPAAPRRKTPRHPSS